VLPGSDGFMALALREAYKGSTRGDGGPFGACIVRKGKVLALGHNRVLRGRNATLHAEVVAIARASRKLGTHLLEGCTIYSTTEPCVMCFAAINWAKMDKVYFGTTVMDVKKLGFNELTISNATLKRLGRSPLRIVPGHERAACLDLLRHWQALPKRRTY